ncbi:type II toxin-antitoxin system RelE/ParE family toxin [Neptuniibacter sp. QD34_54]|uniref:type II toxin-antitoxin system RelE/ParE family toxin n=1 Tax=Neptuniibacter sp. QD34_54 TaxID=3398208 RepID=UPI0039F44E82
MKTYSFTDEAVADLEGIIEHSLTAWGQNQTRLYISELEQLCENLAGTPFIGQPCNELSLGLRLFHFRSHTLYYTRADNGICIARILHKKMNTDLYF